MPSRLTSLYNEKGILSMEITIPQPLKSEHDNLHEELVKATNAGGKIAEAAKAVAALLHPHFVKEEAYALPPLGMLPQLAEGNITPEMDQVLQMTERLKAELPQMLQEHQAIVAALKTLADVAKQEQLTEYARFAEKLLLHARTEEDVLYPTTILIGEYLKLKLDT
jgi:hemerythrin-like domain-containing protein